MLDTNTDQSPPKNHNNPPEEIKKQSTTEKLKVVLHKESIELTKQVLKLKDVKLPKAITTEKEAEEILAHKKMADAELKEAEKLRKARADTYNALKTVIQDHYNPIKADAKGIKDRCATLLTPWLNKKQEEEAEKKRKADQELREKAQAASLAAETNTEKKAAEVLERKADRAVKKDVKASVSNEYGDRASTRTETVITIDDRVKIPHGFLLKYINDDEIATLVRRAITVRKQEGKDLPVIPGIKITKEQRAV